MVDLPKGLRVAAYLRNSTDAQEFSIEGQQDVIRREVDNNGWILVEQYRDEGESGATTANRPGLQRLLRDAGGQRFALALMYDVSRVTRGGTSEFWWLVHQFKVDGIQLYCCARRQIANEKNAPLFTVDAMQAREENIKRSRDATRGKHQGIFDRDQDPGRRPPFGYDHLRVDIAAGTPVERIRYLRDDTKQIMTPDGDGMIRVIPLKEEYRKGASLRTVLVPGDPDDVALVRRIFRGARVLGLQRQAGELNRDGLTGPHGRKWSASGIRGILPNPAYIGHRVVNRGSKARYHRHGKGGVEPKDETEAGRIDYLRRPESEWSVWEGKHEARVDAGTFREVHAALERRRGDKLRNRKGRNQEREYLLSGGGYITCGRCGAGLNGTTATSKGRRYPEYYCSANRRHGAPVCAGYSIPMDELDGFVLNEVKARATTSDCSAALAGGLEKEFARRLERQRPMSAEEAEAVGIEQAGIERTKRQIVEAIKANPEAIELMKLDGTSNRPGWVQVSCIYRSGGGQPPKETETREARRVKETQPAEGAKRPGRSAGGAGNAWR